MKKSNTSVLTNNWAWSFLILPVVLFVFAAYFSVNILYTDDISMILQYQRYESGKFPLLDILWTPHNEHIMFIPKMFFFLTVPISHMNSNFYAITNVVLISLSFFFVIYALKRQLNAKWQNISLFFILIPLFMFSFRQQRNLTWAFQNAWYMAHLFVVLSVLFFSIALNQYSNYKRQLMMAVSCLFSAFAAMCSAMGLFSFFSILALYLLLLFFDKKKFNGYEFVVWLLICVYFFVIYKSGGGKIQSTDSKIAYVLQNPFKFVYFFFLLISQIGFHIYHVQKVAFFVGVGFFIFVLYNLYITFKNKTLSQNIFWVGIILFGLIFAFITGLGRVSSGLGFTDRDRYTIFTSLIYVGSFVLFYFNFKNTGTQALRYGFMYFLAFGIMLSVIGGYRAVKLKQEKTALKNTLIYLNEHPNLKYSDCEYCIEQEKFMNKHTASKIPYLQELSPYLKQNKYNLYANQ